MAAKESSALGWIIRLAVIAVIAYMGFTIYQRKQVERKHNAGIELLQAGQYEAALPVLQGALREDPDNIRILNALGASHYELDHVGDAVQYWDKSLALNPQQPAIREALEEARRFLP